MKNILCLLFILGINGGVFAQRKEVVTLLSPTEIAFSYRLPNANIGFTFVDVMLELDALQKKYPKLTRNDSLVFRTAYQYLTKNFRCDIRYNNPSEEPGELAFEYLFNVHVVAKLLAEGKAKVHNLAGEEVEQILQQKLKKAGHAYDSYKFSFIKGELFFSGDIYALESGDKNNTAPDLTPLAVQEKSQRVVESQAGGDTQVSIGEVIYDDAQVIERMAESSPEDPDKIYLSVEISPEPPGGYAQYELYLLENQRYPEQAKQMGIEGKVFVEFVVNTDGTLQDFGFVKGINNKLDKEAMRLIKEGGTWTPGKNNGRNVRAWFVMPVTFKLK